MRPRRRGRTGRRRSESSEPWPEAEPDGEEWVEWGGELIWVADWTEGGAPVGLTLGEWRAAQCEDSSAGWARAASALEGLGRLRCGQGARVELGRVTRVGSGLSRAAFAADLSLAPDPEKLSGAYAVLLPGQKADPKLSDRMRHELALLRVLAASELPFRVPRPLGVWPDRHGPALVRAFVPGVELDLRAGRQPSVRPWQVVAEIAAGVHRIATTPLPGSIADHATRRAHALAALEVLDGLEAPEARDARAWATENAAPAEPSTLLHGDLLGQNILLDPTSPRSPGVIDWEYATLGDPACDLAIVTRGVRQPFQIAGGIDRLLEAYAKAGGQPVTRAHVRVHELALAGTWYRAALERPDEGRRPEEELARLRRVLQVAEAG